MSLITTTISLALVDAVNPCALAVMAIMLTALLFKNPKNRSRVLIGGLMFTLAVFILYFLYGAILVQFFSHLIPETSLYSLYIFKGFGILAILLGLLNLKDFLNYKPGGVGTEMPIFMRPKVKALINKATSPAGAFIVGLFVTIFLLPCTIGPYIIASGNLSQLSFYQTIPLLLLYNLIFILPMIAITLVIYLGLTTVENVSGWKEKNTRYLHLVEALILIILGILMFTGII
ncbi:MAG: GAP family protein [Nanoarchaeota archaeon]|nr:GAP family protein [Nanoarchaeota archaeon]MBU0977695.1 GAP family protein [Nanoarchaeota archaeon]